MFYLNTLSLMKIKNSSCKMVQANHHSKSKHLTSDRPLKNGTILNQNVKTVIIGMAFGFPSLVFKPPLHVEKGGQLTDFVFLGQGWPHFLCCGQKNGLKKLGGTKMCQNKLGRQNIIL